MDRLMIILSLFMSFCFVSPALAQSKIQSDVGISPSMKRYIEIEQQLEQGLPMILEKIKGTANLVKKNDFVGAQTYMRQAIEEARVDEKILSK